MKVHKKQGPASTITKKIEKKKEHTKASFINISVQNSKKTTRPFKAQKLKGGAKSEDREVNSVARKILENAVRTRLKFGKPDLV